MSGMFGGVFRRSPKKPVHPLPVILSIGAGDGQQATVGTAVAVRPRFDTTYAADGTAAPGVPVSAIDFDGKQYHGVTDANGHWLLPVEWLMPTLVGVYHLTASIAGSPTSKTITATAIAGAAFALIPVSPVDQSGSPGAGAPVLPKVQAVDLFGNAVEAVPIVYAVTTGGGSASGLSGNSAADGTLEVGSWTLGGSVGTNTMTASSAGLIGSPINFRVSVAASLPTQIAWFSGEGQSVAAGAVYVTPLIPRVLDAGSNPVSGINVVLDAPLGGGSVPAPLLTDANGKVSFLPIAGTVVGAGQFRATFFDNGGNPVSVTDDMTIIAGAADHLVIVVQPDSHTTSGQPLPQQPVLHVVDQYGNLVTAGTYHVTRSVVAGDATLSGNTTVDSVSGVVTYTALVVTDPTGGDSQLDFQASGLLDVISDPVTTAPPTPDHQVIVTQPVAQVLGSVQTVVVKTVDAGGGPIPGDTSPAVPTLTDNTEGATLIVIGSSTVNGVTTINYQITAQTGSFTLTFARAGLPDVISSPFGVSASGGGGFNEPGGFVQAVLRDLTNELLDTAWASGQNHGGLVSGTGASNMKVRRISDPTWYPAGVSQMPACPNGKDRVVVCQFGGATIPAGEKGIGTITFGTSVKSIYLRMYVLISSNWYGQFNGSGSGDFKRTFIKSATGGPTILDFKQNPASAPLGATWLAAYVGANVSAGAGTHNMVAMAKNVWHLVEMLIVAQSGAGVNDGHLTYWVDGVKKYQLTGVKWWSADVLNWGNASQSSLDYYGGSGAASVPTTPQPQFAATGDGEYWSTSTSRAAVP